MRAHEETWTTDWDEHGGYDCMSSGHALRADRFTVLAVFDSKAQPRHLEDPEQGARAKLAAQAPAMARLLLGCQFVEMSDERGGYEERCAVCLNRSALPPVGAGRIVLDHRPDHAPDCELVAVLRAAGVVE